MTIPARHDQEVLPHVFSSEFAQVAAEASQDQRSVEDEASQRHLVYKKVEKSMTRGLDSTAGGTTEKFHVDGSQRQTKVKFDINTEESAHQHVDHGDEELLT